LNESTSPRAAGQHEEIERKYLLSALPAMPQGTEVLRIEQGYLPDSTAEATEGGDPPPEGRVRRIVDEDGSVRMTHTIKTGHGLRRTEIERAISADEFERYWPLTEGRRLRKKRYRACGAGAGAAVVWEIDAFEDRDLVLAEVELQNADEEIAFPPWLAQHVLREVTEDPSYRNYALAVGGAPGGGAR
jgi:CYTH domain-containing protein